MIQKEDLERLLNENQGKHTYVHIYRLRTRPEAEKVFQVPESTANDSLGTGLCVFSFCRCQS